MAKKKDLSTGMPERTGDSILTAICAAALFIVAYPLNLCSGGLLLRPLRGIRRKDLPVLQRLHPGGCKAVFAEKSIVAGFLSPAKYTAAGSVCHVFDKGGNNLEL